MGGFNKHLVITGTARSGTSWLSETIARQHRYRLLFEPEHEIRTTHGAFLCDQWLEHSSHLDEANAYLKRLLLNRVDCDWIAQNSNRKFKRHLWPFIPRKIIIKFVRGNLLANYMCHTYQVPIVHVLRNPYDVINSQKRSSFPWLQDLHIFSVQEELTNLLYQRFKLDLNECHHLNIVKRRAIRWCIENVLPIEEWKVGGVGYEVVRYENLFSNVDVFYALCERFHLKPVANLEQIYKQPSTKTHKDSVIKKGSSKRLLLTTEIDDISEILDIFNTRLYEIY